MKLLALDMDGTCLNSYSKISPTTMDALYLARTSGIEIVPTTGRALSCIPHQLRKTRRCCRRSERTKDSLPCSHALRSSGDNY